ncbi:MAG: aminopeptidase N [Bdellovibrionales bacterium]|nr:aminopeptidase N [Bdellovibrionales bacterium]
MKKQPQIVHLKDYQPPAYLIPTVNIKFDLFEDETLVTSTLTVERAAKTAPKTPFVLYGEDLELISIKSNGVPLDKEDYTLTEETLTIDKPTSLNFELEIKTRIFPQNNKSFSGLYKTKKIFCTQMEAQGFRRVTYFPDRPDVLSRYTTTVTAEKSKYPYLLSNGHCVKTETLGSGRHTAVWVDPFPKPCYLFALVAGDLGKTESTFTTKSGRTVQLEIYTDKGNESRSAHAMESLKQAMKWDEDVFDLEYDLDLYMIVAVDDFNMGAMENKGLNIFNTKYVLADKQSATDAEYTAIQGVIGHEYFHNWSGNRVTCRDWFQLSLKEGLTVFRDEEFTSDLNSRAVKRIDDVNLIRTRQFPEDSSGMAHPIRPPSYLTIDNFYTSTVYIKGAAVIRMLQTLLGRETFIAGVKKYFEIYDGQAVTTEDFIKALENVSGKDLSQFRDSWYNQAGTPTVKVKTNYDRDRHEYMMTFTQKTIDPVTKKVNKPYVIPISIGLFNSQGIEILPLVKGKKRTQGNTATLELNQAEQTFTFTSVSQKPVPSILRNFSAPIHLHYEASDSELHLLMSSDVDPFNRWEAAQRMYQKAILANVANLQNNKPLTIPPNLLAGYAKNLSQYRTMDHAYLARLLQLPQINYIVQFLEPFDIKNLEKSYLFFKRSLRDHCLQQFKDIHSKLVQLPDDFSSAAVQGRSLKSVVLDFITCDQADNSVDLLSHAYFSAKNMTDSLSALWLLSQTTHPKAQKALEDFKQRWRDDSLVINKWFSIQSASWHPSTFETVKKLEQDSLFDKTNPNKIYSLHATFAGSNPFRFHGEYQKTYAWLTDAILDIDQRNPQVASRLATSFNDWTKWSPEQQKVAETQLLRIKNDAKTSKNVFEIADRALGMKL